VRSAIGRKQAAWQDEGLSSQHGKYQVNVNTGVGVWHSVGSCHVSRSGASAKTTCQSYGPGSPPSVVSIDVSVLRTSSPRYVIGDNHWMRVTARLFSSPSVVSINVSVLRQRILAKTSGKQPDHPSLPSEQLSSRAGWKAFGRRKRREKVRYNSAIGDSARQRSYRAPPHPPGLGLRSVRTGTSIEPRGIAEPGP
jgi:hypothetical protein